MSLTARELSSAGVAELIDRLQTQVRHTKRYNSEEVSQGVEIALHELKVTLERWGA
jgi:hypothetical protein